MKLTLEQLGKARAADDAIWAARKAMISATIRAEGGEDVTDFLIAAHLATEQANALLNEVLA